MPPLRSPKPAECSGQIVGYWVTWLDRMGQPRQKFVKVLHRALGLQKRLPLGSRGKVQPKFK